MSNSLPYQFSEIARRRKEREIRVYFRSVIVSQDIYISVWYDIGGMSFLAGRSFERGYWLSVAPVDVGLDDNGHITSVVERLFIGNKFLLKKTKRFSAKDFGAMVILCGLNSTQNDLYSPTATGMIKRLVTDNHIEIYNEVLFE